MALLFFAVLLAFTHLGIGCGKEGEKAKNPGPFLSIQDGHFQIEASILAENATSAGPALGSGSLSFNFSGDTSGTYAISGALVDDQTENQGVGAILAPIDDEEFGTVIESFVIIGFDPTGRGKADIFLLSTKIGVVLDSITAGNTYGIGAFADFNGLFFNGLNISEFWAGERNFIDIADRAFIIEEGIIQITATDSTHISGTFFGTTDPGRNALSRQFILDNL